MSVVSGNKKLANKMNFLYFKEKNAHIKVHFFRFFIVVVVVMAAGK